MYLFRLTRGQRATTDFNLKSQFTSDGWTNDQKAKKWNKNKKKKGGGEEKEKMMEKRNGKKKKKCQFDSNLCTYVRWT